METGVYLAQVAGDANPRRCFIQSNDPERLVEHAIWLYRLSCHQLHAAFEEVLTRRDRILDLLADEQKAAHARELEKIQATLFDLIKNACYPYAALLEQNIRVPIGYMKAFDRTPIKDDYRVTLGSPELLRRTLLTQIDAMTAEGLTLEVGLDLVPVPLPMALDRDEFRQTTEGLTIREKSFFQFLQTSVPMPSVVEIEDAIIDGTTKTRRESDVVHREYKFFNSSYWTRYMAHLRSGDWADVTWAGLVGAIDSPPSAWTTSTVSAWPPAYAVTDRAAPKDTPARDPLGLPRPFAYFEGQRIDHSIMRLRHYTLTDIAHFQRHILFTNYRQYVDKFLVAALREVVRRDGGLVVCSAEQYSGRGARGTQRLYGPGEARDILARIAVDGDPQAFDRAVLREIVRDSDAQMPTYHYVPPDEAFDADAWLKTQRLTRDGFDSRRQWLSEVLVDGTPLPGITLIHIGVGASNARNITDHLAVLRPRFWIMVGHCGGIRRHQKIGDYVIAHAYVRRDGVLDDEVPLDIPIPQIEEIQQALREAAQIKLYQAGTFGVNEYLDTVRTGTVYTTSNRNWETAPAESVIEIFEKSRAIGVDMESATIAANGYRYRVPYGAFLCVSDKPLHGAMKMRFFADDFYRAQIDQHMDITLNVVRLLGYDAELRQRLDRTRKLRGLDDPPLR